MKFDVYTDGACSGNPGRGGWAWAAIKDNEVWREGYGGQRTSTNNKMELLAVIDALETLPVFSELVVYTDSQYVQKGITEWIIRWRKNGWKTVKGAPVKNRGLWQRLDVAVLCQDITWEWVAGHSGNRWNEYVNDIAQAQTKIGAIR